MPPAIRDDARIQRLARMLVLDGLRYETFDNIMVDKYKDSPELTSKAADDPQAARRLVVGMNSNAPIRVVHADEEDVRRHKQIESDLTRASRELRIAILHKQRKPITEKNIDINGELNSLVNALTEAELKRLGLRTELRPGGLPAVAPEKAR